MIMIIISNVKGIKLSIVEIIHEITQLPSFPIA